MSEFKDIKLNVDINTSQRFPVSSNQEFRSYDRQAARLIISVTKNNEKMPENAIEKIRIFMSSVNRNGTIIDGMQYQVDLAEIIDGQVMHVLPDDYLKYDGYVVIHVYVIFQNQATNDSGQAFLIRFKKSAIDDSNAENVVPNYFKSFDDILTEVQSVADEKTEQIENAGIDIGEYVKDYLAESPDIATKDYVNAKADVSDELLKAWLYLESEGKL